jgi:calcineurin-like phosphoesterase
VKTIIKLLIALAIINATARVGLAAAKYYQLKDQSQELVTFGGNVLPGELQNQILEKAEALQLPLNFDDIEVTREGLHTSASASYTQSVEVFPNYKYPIRFQFRVEGINMGAGVDPGGNPLRNK